MKTARWFLLLFSICLAAGRSARAHPVAQGALDLQVFPDKIHLELRVSGG